MPPTKKNPPRPTVRSLYELEDVRRELVRLDDPSALGKGWRKEAAAAIGMTQAEFSKHINAPNAARFFSFVELGLIAAWHTRDHGATPPGWPFVTFRTWSAATAIAKPPESGRR